MASREYQAEQGAFVQALKAENIIPSSTVYMRDAASEGGDLGSIIYLGQHTVPLVKEGLTLLGAALVAWLTARGGRKVRLKFGDVEVEAGTPKEIEQILEHAKKFQQDSGPKSDPDSE